MRIRRQQPNPPDVKIMQDGGGYAVIAGVDREPQAEVRVDGVEARILERVRVQLGMQADATSLMPP